MFSCLLSLYVCYFSISIAGFLLLALLTLNLRTTILLILYTNNSQSAVFSSKPPLSPWSMFSSIFWTLVVQMCLKLNIVIAKFITNYSFRAYFRQWKIASSFKQQTRDLKLFSEASFCLYSVYQIYFQLLILVFKFSWCLHPFNAKYPNPNCH